MERLAIFAALRWECRPILGRLRQVRRMRVDGLTLWCGETATQEVWLTKTGMGMQRAQQAADSLRRHGAFDLFVSTGCAGALCADLKPGDVAVASTIIRAGTEVGFATDARTVRRMRRAAERAALHAVVGPVLCGSTVLTTAAAKRAAAAGGAVAVEMEGAAIAACAAQNGIPFASVRAILDTADTELVDAGRFVQPQTGGVRPLALAAYLATHPGALPRLLALQRMANAAQTSLENFFAQFLSMQ